MQKVTIKFETIHDLLSFLGTLPEQGYFIEPKSLTLTCSCNHVELATAMNDFGATLVSKSAPML